MNRKTTTISALAGAGLAAAFFFGCQNPGQSAAGNTQDTQASLLSLAVKDSGDCRSLHARCAIAHEAGKDSAALTDTLVGACIIDTAKARQILEEGRFGGGRHGRHGDNDGDGPGRLDSAARAAMCDSLTKVVAGMDSTDSGYAIAKAHAAMACFVPPAPLDSAARAALCDSLKTKLSSADSSSAGYAILSHATHEACEELRPPKIGRGFRAWQRHR
jgi:hypothetical protein